VGFVPFTVALFGLLRSRNTLSTGVHMLPIPKEIAFRLEAALVDARLDRKWSVRRDALVICLGLCGLRWEEVSRVKIRHLGSDGALEVLTAKGGVRRVLPIGETLIAEMRRLVETRPTLCRGPDVRDGFVFLTSTGHRLPYEGAVRRLRQWTRAICGRAFSLHCLRHTAAIRVYQATRDVLAVQRFLGHRSLQWTESYLRSLVAVDVAGMPSFCTGKPTLRVVSADGGEEEKAEMRVGPGGSNNSTIGPLPGQRSFLEEEALRAGRARGGDVVTVVSPRTMDAGGGTENSTREVEAAAELVPGRDADHDCVACQEFAVVNEQTAVRCSRCGKFLGFVSAKVRALRAQQELFR